MGILGSLPTLRSDLECVHKTYPLAIKAIEGDLLDQLSAKRSELTAEELAILEILADLFFLVSSVYEIVVKLLAIYGYLSCSKKARWCAVLSPVIKTLLCISMVASGLEIYHPEMMDIAIDLVGWFNLSILMFVIGLVAIDNVAVITAATPMKAYINTLKKDGAEGLFVKQISINEHPDLASSLYAILFLLTVSCVYYCWLVSLIWQDIWPKKKDVSEVNNNYNSRSDNGRQCAKKAFKKSKAKSVFGLYSNGDFEGLKKMLVTNKDKISINDRDAKGDTLLHKLCESGRTNIIIQVLKSFPRRINFGAKNQKQLTPLETSISNDQLETVDVLIACKDLPKVDKTSLTMSLSSSAGITRVLYTAFKKHDKLTTKLDSLMNMYLDLTRLEDPDLNAEERIVKYRRLLIREIPSSSSIVSMKKKATNDNGTRDTGNGQARNRKRSSKATDEEVLSDFKCTICSVIMKPPAKIFACSSEHYLCSECIDNNEPKNCTECHENFDETPPRRRITAEKIVEIN